MPSLPPRQDSQRVGTGPLLRVTCARHTTRNGSYGASCEGQSVRTGGGGVGVERILCWVSRGRWTRGVWGRLTSEAVDHDGSRLRSFSEDPTILSRRQMHTNTNFPPPPRVLHCSLSFYPHRHPTMWVGRLSWK